MATVAQQNALRDAIKSGDKNKIAAAERDAMSNSGSEKNAAGTAAALKSGGNTSAARKPPAVNVAPTQKAAQDWIASSTPGGLASYVRGQVNRYQNAGNDTDLRSRLEKDARDVGYSLPQLADNRPAREKYGEPTNDEDRKALETYEKDLKEKGYARLPDYLQDKAGQGLEDLWRQNSDAFLSNHAKFGNDTTKAMAKNNQEAISRAPSMYEVIANGGKYGYVPTARADYRGSEPGGDLSEREASFNWDTGEIKGNAKLLDQNYNIARDSSSGLADSVRNKLFDDEFQSLVDKGQLSGDQESRDWFNSYKDKWNVTNRTDDGFAKGTQMNATLASLLASQQAKPIEEEKTPAGAPAPAPTPAVPTSELGQGSKGDEVRALQKSLGITADGIFGPQTAAALKAYQAKNNLPASGKADGSTLAALQSASQQVQGATDNQVKYLQGLVATGGGEAEWAKGQLKKLGVDAPAPQTAAQHQAAPEVKDPQTGGLDFYASATKALENGELETALAFANKRAAKIAGLEAQGQDVSVYKAQQEKLMASIQGASPEGAIGLEAQLKTVMADGQADQEKMLKEIEKFVEESGDSGLKEEMDKILSYDEAKDRAGDKLNPLYDTARTERREQVTNDQLRRGFFGQAAGATHMLEETDKIENQRASDVATLAQTLVGQSKDDAYKNATLRQQQTQTKLSNMLSLLQARGVLSSTAVSNLSTLLNNENQKKAQATADKQLEADMFGVVDGKMTLAYQNMLKQWGYSDAEAARANQLFPHQLESAKLSVAAAKKSLAQIGVSKGIDAAKAAADAAKAVETGLKSARDEARKAGEAAEKRVKDSRTSDSPPTVAEMEAAYNTAHDRALKSLVPTDFYEEYRLGRDPFVSKINEASRP